MRHHVPIVIRSEQRSSVRKRFMKKVDVINAQIKNSSSVEWCWLWTAGTFNGRVGEFKLNGERYSARRISYELFKGNIRPSSSFVMNHCKNKLCVNPEHLYLREKRNGY